MSFESPDASRAETTLGPDFTSGGSTPRTQQPDASKGPRNWPVRGSSCSSARHFCAERSANPRNRRILILPPAVRCQTAGRICMTAFNDAHARVCMRFGIVLPCSTTVGAWRTHGRPGTARFMPMLIMAQRLSSLAAGGIGTRGRALGAALQVRAGCGPRGPHSSSRPGGACIVVGLPRGWLRLCHRR